jgi:hypothetical protein
VLAFQHNNAIIRAFRVGLLAPLRAVLRFTPTRVWVVLLGVAALAGALQWLLRGRA